MYMQSYGEKDEGPEVLPELQAINLNVWSSHKSTTNAIKILSILDRYMYSGTSNGHVKLWTDRGAFARVAGDLWVFFYILYLFVLGGHPH
jgi:hypothetical protein